jgi:hypothetical protein
LIFFSDKVSVAKYPRTPIFEIFQMFILGFVIGPLVLIGALMIGHWSADIVWLTLVSTGVSKGRTIVSDTSYEKIIALCGIFLIFFGTY